MFISIISGSASLLTGVKEILVSLNLLRDIKLGDITFRIMGSN